MIFGRSAIYFDEVARCGSIRRAAAHLHIAPSAVDRQILQLEQHVGVPLFERRQNGLRLTTAGEMLIDAVRRWQRDMKRVKSHIDDLQGLRRGEVSIALVEGAAELLSQCLAGFHSSYPGIAFRMQAAGAQAVADGVLNDDYELGITFNPTKNNALRIERKLVYHLGAVVRADHPLAAHRQVSLATCCNYPLIIPDETISLRRVLDQLWARSLGESPHYCATASSVGLIKSMVMNGMGVGMLTALDVLQEIRSGRLIFVSLDEERTPPSVLCIVSASGRTLSAPASLLLQHLSQQLDSAAPT